MRLRQRTATVESAGRRTSSSTSKRTLRLALHDLDVGDLADGDAGQLHVVAVVQAGDVVENVAASS